MLSQIIDTTNSSLLLVGVGGVMNASDVRDRLAAGAHNVHLATAPMLNQFAGIDIRRALAS